MKNIYLIGMMGSGKSSSGRALAKLLSLAFVDLDELIVEQEGRSINDIFKAEGESYFRSLEHELLAGVARETDQVIATGGGIVLDPVNCEQMKDSGLVIYLKTGLDVLWERVKTKQDRPLLKGSDPKQMLANLYAKRSSLYEAVSDKVFLTDRKTPGRVAAEIYETCFKST